MSSKKAEFEKRITALEDKIFNDECGYIEVSLDAIERIEKYKPATNLGKSMKDAFIILIALGLNRNASITVMQDIIKNGFN
jgi:hypothetical protein